MFKGAFKRITSLFIAVVMIFTLVPFTTITASAADLSGLTDSNIGLSYTENGTVSWSADQQTINGSVTGYKFLGFINNASYSYLTIENKKSHPALLSFDYTVTIPNGGSITIDGNSVTASGTFQKTIASNGTVEVYIKSPSGSGTTSIKITNIRLVVNTSVNVVFDATTNGLYTVYSDSIGETKTVSSDSYSVSQNSMVPFKLVATANSGYKFVSWHSSVSGYFSDSSTINELYLDESQIITAEFAPTSAPVFETNNKHTIDLNEAVAWAQSGSEKKITLVSNGTLPAGNYSIPNGITLLVPFDGLHTVVTTVPEVVYGSHSNPSAYKILTMASGAEIIVASGGAISLSGKLCSSGQMGGWNGTPTGPDGRINMQSGSSITLESGANLYCWGYIYGSGSVVAKSGATVYEAFQIKDWRGGSATSSVYNYAFILSQYYIQNIEVPLTLYAGATEKLYSSANASSTAYPMGATFVGSGGMFNVSSGYMIKDYIESTDRLQLDFYGNASVTPMTLTGLPMIGSISTEDYVLPITSNITVNIHSGKTSVTQDIKMLPSTEINIDSGATLQINSGKKLYVYDNDNWGNFTGKAKLYVIGYSVANGTTAKRTASSLKDAKINVNGTVNVAGSFFTSNGGADITSSLGSGKIVFSIAPTASTTIYEMEDNSTKTAVSFTAAKLHNGQNTPNYNGSEYTSTVGLSANTTVPYIIDKDKWSIDKTITVHYMPNADDVTGTMNDQELIVGESGKLNKNVFEKNGYSFIGWSLMDPDDNENVLPDEFEFDGAASEELESIGTDIYLYAQWEKDEIPTYTIIWKNWDGTVLKTDTVEEGTVPEYTGATPTKAGNAQYSYTFTGWTPTVAAVTADVTYTAQFSTTLREYTVTWKNFDDTVLKEEEVPYGTVPEYDGTPVRPGTNKYYYKFTEWQCIAGNIVYGQPITCDVIYQAFYKEYSIYYEWSSDNSEVTARAVYRSEEIIETKATVRTVTTEPTCTTGGQAVYTVTFEGEYFTTQTKTVNLPATGHSYGEPEWTWADDYSSATAKFTCECGDIQNVKAEIASATTPATHTAAGQTVYTATVTFNGQTYTDTKTVTIPAQGHSYGEPTWEWADDYSSATAKFTCECGDIQNVKAEIASATTPATHTAAGKTVYTATVSFNGQAYTDTKTVTIPAQGHSYGEPEWTWTGNDEEGYTATATFTCTSNDDTQEITAEISVDSTAVDKIVYTATVSFGGKTYSDTKNVTKKYIVQFINHDNTVLQSSEVAYGTTPTYDGATPTKKADAQYTYEFSGWDPAITEVTGNATYTAQFSSTVNKYTVTWVIDGVEETEVYEYGTMPTHNDPEKEADAQYTYTFTGWSPAIAEVTGDATYTAQFSSTVNKYTVTWIIDGVEETEEYEYGATPAHADPTKEANAQYTYTFTGWTPAITEVTGNATYTAQFSSTVNKYTVTWIIDGVEETEEYEYGATPAYNGEMPHKAPDETNIYVFAGWDPEITTVTGNATYTAVFEAETAVWTGPVWSWTDFAENGFNATAKATATFTSDTDTISKTVDVTGELVKIDGKDTTYAYKYTATVEFNGQTYTDTYSHEFEAVTLIGQTPTLNGVLSINFRFQAPENAATVKFVYEFNNTEVELRLAKDGPYFITEGTSERYKIAYTNIQSACITKNVTMKVYDADGNEMTMIRLDKNFYGTEFSYCMADWAKAMLDNPEKPEETKQLAHAILNYGYYASEYFGEKNGNAEKYSFNYEKYGEYLDLSMVENVTVDQENDAVGADEAKTNTSYKGALVVLEGSTSIRLYFDSTKAAPTVKDAAGKAYTVYKNEIGYYVEVSGIGSGNLNRKYTFVITGENGVDYTVKYSVLSWANAMITRGNGANNEYVKTVNLAKALYQYWAAADTYFAIH